MQEVAHRAGLARSVIYRHFDNREDLDAHIRAFILQRYVDEFESVLVLDPARTVDETILEVMRTVVRWAGEHPTLYRFARSGPVFGHAAGESTLAIARQRVADTLWQRFLSWTAVLGIDVEPFHPLVYGIVGLVEGVVTQFLEAPRDPAFADQETIARMLASSVWHLFAGHAAELGYHFERSATIAAALGELFADAAGTFTPRKS